MAKPRWLIVLMALLGCDLADPQGPGMQWERPEQQRLDALKEKCDGQPWESAGVVCLDDIVIATRPGGVKAHKAAIGLQSEGRQALFLLI